MYRILGLLNRAKIIYKKDIKQSIEILSKWIEHYFKLKQKIQNQ